MLPEGRALELLIAAVVALIVVGPKDLPVLLRKLGQFMAKVRSMAAEFRASFDEMARQSELDELRKEVEAMRQGSLTDIATHAPEMNQAFNEISQGLSDVGVDLNANSGTPYVGAQTEDLPLPPAKTGRARLAEAKRTGRPLAKPAAAAKSAAPKKAAPKKAAPKKAAVKKAAVKAPVKSKVTPKPAVKTSAAKPPTPKTPATKAPTPKTAKPVKPAASSPVKTPRGRKAAAS